jgi:hypothetical protein
LWKKRGQNTKGVLIGRVYERHSQQRSLSRPEELILDPINLFEMYRLWNNSGEINRAFFAISNRRFQTLKLINFWKRGFEKKNNLNTPMRSYSIPTQSPRIISTLLTFYELSQRITSTFTL